MEKIDTNMIRQSVCILGQQEDKKKRHGMDSGFQSNVFLTSTSAASVPFCLLMLALFSNKYEIKDRHLYFTSIL